MESFQSFSRRLELGSGASPKKEQYSHLLDCGNSVLTKHHFDMPPTCSCMSDNVDGSFALCLDGLHKSAMHKCWWDHITCSVYLYTCVENGTSHGCCICPTSTCLNTSLSDRHTCRINPDPKVQQQYWLISRCGSYACSRISFVLCRLGTVIGGTYRCRRKECVCCRSGAAFVYVLASLDSFGGVTGTLLRKSRLLW